MTLPTGLKPKSLFMHCETEFLSLTRKAISARQASLKCYAKAKLSSVYIIVHGMQQTSQEPPSGQGHCTHPVFGPVGFSREVLELLLLDAGRTLLIGAVSDEMAIA